MDLSEALRNAHLLSTLEPAQLEQVKRTTRLVRLPEGQTLFEAGHPAQRFFLVRSGQLKLFRLSQEGNEKILEIVRPGETFAEAVMFLDVKVYPVSAAALMPSEVYSFDNQTYLRVLRDSVDTCFRVMGSMSRRLRMLIGEIDDLTLQSATHRLITFLLQRLSNNPNPLHDIHLDTPKSVIASRLSVQPETFSRILKNLSKEGLLSVHGQIIRVHDLTELRRRGIEADR